MFKILLVLLPIFTSMSLLSFDTSHSNSWRRVGLQGGHCEKVVQKENVQLPESVKHTFKPWVQDTHFITVKTPTELVRMKIQDSTTVGDIKILLESCLGITILVQTISPVQHVWWKSGILKKLGLKKGTVLPDATYIKQAMHKYNTDAFKLSGTK